MYSFYFDEDLEQIADQHVSAMGSDKFILYVLHSYEK